MIHLILLATGVDPSPAVNLNTLVSGGVGAGVVSGVIYVIKLILDRTVPSRSDARANVTLVIEGLNNMVTVLQEEKKQDAERLDEKQKRIDLLQEAAEKDYDRITELRQEIIDLRTRLATKDRHINSLVAELRKLGRTVTGLDLVDADVAVITITDATPGLIN